MSNKFTKPLTIETINGKEIVTNYDAAFFEDPTIGFDVINAADNEVSVETIRTTNDYSGVKIWIGGSRKEGQWKEANKKNVFFEFTLLKDPMEAVLDAIRQRKITHASKLDYSKLTNNEVIRVIIGEKGERKTGKKASRIVMEKLITGYNEDTSKATSIQLMELYVASRYEVEFIPFTDDEYLLMMMINNPQHEDAMDEAIELYLNNGNLTEWFNDVMGEPTE